MAKRNEIMVLAVELDHCLVLGECPAWVELLPGMMAQIGQITGVIREAARVEKGAPIYQMLRLLYGKPEQVTRVWMQDPSEMAKKERRCCSTDAK